MNLIQGDEVVVEGYDGVFTFQGYEPYFGYNLKCIATGKFLIIKDIKLITKIMDSQQPTPEQIRDTAIEQFTTFARHKFDKGQAEHGGSILDRCMIDDMEAEIVDMWFYLQALKIKLQKLEPKDK